MSREISGDRVRGPKSGGDGPPKSREAGRPKSGGDGPPKSGDAGRPKSDADGRSKRTKREVGAELIDEIRRSQNATDRYDQAVADALGLNRTDMRCLDILDREGRVPAGRLAEAMGLTTAAITTVLDRLERAGYARRERDPADRRRVLVELTPETKRRAAGFYAEHAALADRVLDRYTLEQLELLLAFVRGSREFNERAAERLEAENRARGG
jgi:DNA-binding MarR family transcriptional regulator